MILEREQYYLDKIFLTEPKLDRYNILSTAGSSLGFKHSIETKAAMSLAKKGVAFSEEHKARLRQANLGDHNANFGKSHSAETKAAISEAMSGENHPMFDKFHSAETRTKIGIANGTTIYVYSSDKSTIVNSFSSATKAAEHFKCHRQTIINYTKSGKLFKDLWILSSIPGLENKDQ